MRSTLLTLALLTAAVPAAVSGAEPVTAITLHPERAGARINPAMWGIFFEDINFGADGGLYAELVKNRGFEFPDPLMGWTTVRVQLARGQVTIRDDAPFNPKNPHYARVQSQGTGLFGLSNEGFRGMGVKHGEPCDFSARLRCVTGHPALIVRLYAGDGTVLDEARLTDIPADWTPRTLTLHPHDTDGHARLALLLDGSGTLDLDFVSLFPENTWQHRPGGLRADMVQALADLHPGFLRFPGGCVVEGPVLAQRYQWKQTLGPVEERPLAYNRWNSEFLHRPTPDYYQSFGLGFLEYFQLCEDIGAQPLPILNCGMACEFNSSELCPLDHLQPYIQDALDLIEFANGPVTTPWGAQRAALGHPQPFGLHLLGVGNEQWGEAYFDRYARFAAALKARYPDVQLVSAAGPDPDGDKFKLAWQRLRPLNADLIDEHCYAGPQWFFDHAHRYDHYDRSGPKVFMGEYAVQSVGVCSPKNQNDLTCALAEAAYLTGLERNADVVRMASYAPLFANTEAWQWRPDLIWVDSLHVVRTPSYYVQQLYACNRGDAIVALDVTGPATTNQLYASAVGDGQTGDLIVKAVNASHVPLPLHLRSAGEHPFTQARLTVLAANGTPRPTPGGETVLLQPVTETQPCAGKFDHTLPPDSFTVIRLATRP